MKMADITEFAEYLELFRQHFNLDARLPDAVFKIRDGYRFVIRESGDMHRLEVFEKLARIYGDKQLNYLMIDPEAEGVFITDLRFLAYSLSFDADFRKEWEVKLRGIGQGDASVVKVWPWMLANLQCYLGSSGKWCSYHDNQNYEVDIFEVPDDCDVTTVFGKPSWTFENFFQISSLHNLKFDQAELKELRRNYFQSR